MFTFTMLIDGFDDCEVFSAPKQRGRFDAVIVGTERDTDLEEQEAATAEAPIVPASEGSRVLFVGTPHQVQSYLATHPHASACALYEQDSPARVPKGCAYRVRTGDTAALVLHIQEQAARFQLWQSRMKLSLLENGGYQRLVDCSEPILGNFISITDLNFRLLACTHGIQPDDDVSKRLVKNGYHDAETVALFSQHHLFKVWERQRGLVIHEHPLTADTESASYIFHMQTTYFVHIIMRFNRRTRTPALMDTFDIFVEHLEMLVKREWRQRRGSESAYGRTLTGLLSGTLTDATATTDELELAGIDRTGHFTVLVFSPGTHVDEPTTSELHYLASQLEGEFPQEQVVEFGSHVVIVHEAATSTGQREKSAPHRELLPRVTAFLNVHGGICGCSNEVDSPFDVSFAYQQACFALARFTAPLLASGEKPSSFLMRFSECYFDFLLFGRSENRPLDWFCRTHGLVEQIAHDDELAGSNNLDIIVTYLSHERRATNAAKALLMHRNSLLYRLEALQKRYDLDFDSYAFRQAFLLEYNLRRQHVV